MFLRGSLLRRSLNDRSLAAGQADPLFHDTLFADLRAVLTQAAATAMQAGSGLWPQSGARRPSRRCSDLAIPVQRVGGA
jgi:hypothetical protein